MAVSYSDRSLSRFDAITSFRWSAIFAGLFAALACQILLSTIGAAIGISATTVTENPDAAKGVGIGAGIWMILSPLVSMFVGGFVAAWLSRPAERGVARLHGALVWCLSLVLGAFFLGSLATGAATGLIGSATTTARQVASNPENREDARQEYQENRDEVRQEIRERVNDPSSREAANTAANVGTGVAWASVLAMVLSLGASILGASAAHKRVFDDSGRDDRLARRETIEPAHIVTPAGTDVRRPADAEGYRPDLH